MRLERYLTESNAEALREAKKKVEIILERLFRRLQKYNFDIPTTADLADDLNKVAPKRLKFLAGGARDAIGKYIHGAAFDATYYPPTLEVTLRQQAAEYFKRFKNPEKQKNFFDIKKNAFARELFNALSHEVVHKMQFMKSKGFPGAYGEIDPNVNWRIYLTNPGELDSFAAQAAVQAATTGRSQIIGLYMRAAKDGDISQKDYKRFLKKYTQYDKELKAMGM